MPIRLKFHFIMLLLLLCGVAAETSADCKVPGDPDILGLGVRLGLYFQLSSTLLVSLVRPKEARDTYLPTALFFTAFFIAVVYSTTLSNSAPGALISVTWYPILLLSFVFSGDWEQHSDEHSEHRMLLGVVIFIASVCLNTWFWFKGLDASHAGQCMDPRCFLFANFSAYGNIRTFFKTFTLFLLILLMLVFLTPTAKVVYDKCRKKTRSADQEIGSSSSVGVPALLPLISELQPPPVDVPHDPSSQEPTASRPPPSTEAATSTSCSTAIELIPPRSQRL